VSAVPLLLWGFLGADWAAPARAYITRPVTTLGQLSASTYVTAVRVEKVSRENGVILFRKVRDLKGNYPRDTIRHVFDLKNTPAHKGSGEVPIRPDERDWKHALRWAVPGKTAVMFTLKYDPYGDFGHTYIDGLWYATMCPPRDWEFWYAIYADPNLLSRWHCGPAAQLVLAVEAILGGREAVVPVLGEGSREDLRNGRARIRGLRVSAAIGDYNPKRDLVTGLLDKTMVPSLVRSLREADGDARLAAALGLGLLGPEAGAAVPALAETVRDDDSPQVRMRAADALERIGPDARSALPAVEAALKDPRLARRKDVLARITAVYNTLKEKGPTPENSRDSTGR
jgi:HEAT repeats